MNNIITFSFISVKVKHVQKESQFKTKAFIFNLM